MQRTVLILGARSDIAMAAAHCFARAGYAVQLAARAAEALSEDASDIAIRHSVTATLHEFDALDVASHDSFFDGLPTLPDVAISAIGFMGEQSENERSIDDMVTVLRSNFEGPASLLTVLANRFATRGSGTLVGISSVAGVRGRATNYVYGSAKAGFTAFLSGLRNRLTKQNVHVVTVLPGFVHTRMTAGINLPARLTAQPEEVANAILTAVRKQRDVIYVRPIWRVIMLIIRHIPERIFKRMKI